MVGDGRITDVERGGLYGTCRKLASAVVIGAIAAGCAGRNAPVERPEYTRIPAAEAPMRDIHLLSGRWERGECSLNLLERKLAYGESGRRAQIVLDIPPEVDLSETVEVFFSARRTVIVTSSHILVSMGGEDILAGRLMLGSVDGTFYPENTRIFRLSDDNPEDDIRGQGVLSAAYDYQETLYLMTRAGYLWWFGLDTAPPTISGSETGCTFAENGEIMLYRGVVVMADSFGITVARMGPQGPFFSTHEFTGRNTGGISFMEADDALTVSVGGRGFKVMVSPAEDEDGYCEASISEMR